jgi:hypothetical protein
MLTSGKIARALVGGSTIPDEFARTTFMYRRGETGRVAFAKQGSRRVYIVWDRDGTQLPRKVRAMEVRIIS